MAWVVLQPVGQVVSEIGLPSPNLGEDRRQHLGQDCLEIGLEEHHRGLCRTDQGPVHESHALLGVQLEEPAPQLKGCGSIHGLAVRPINGAAMYYSRTRSSEAVIVPLSGTSQVD